MSDARQSLCLGVWHFWFFFLDSTEISSLPVSHWQLGTSWLRQATEPYLSNMKKAEVGKNLSQKRAFLRWREFPIAVFPTSVTTERGRYSASSLTGEISHRIMFFWLEENRGQQKFLQNSHERAERRREFPKNSLFFFSRSRRCRKRWFRPFLPKKQHRGASLAKNVQWLMSSTLPTKRTHNIVLRDDETTIGRRSRERNPPETWKLRWSEACSPSGVSEADFGV